ncbi:MAG: ECF transporter S component [Clostridia bacterium]|nr:ECF transporter S component [Clostridia bacterium]
MEQNELEAEQTVAVPETSVNIESRVKALIREPFSAPRIAYMALFTALAYVVTFLEFPLFPGTPASFLKLDFANVFFLFEGFIFGPVEAVVSIGIKEALSLIDSSTMGVGELANFIMSFAYVIVPSVCYRYVKGRKWVVGLLAIACAVQIGVSLLVNRYINFPFFCEFLHVMGDMTSHELFQVTWYFLLAFNVVKSVAISVLVFFLYKPLSRFIRSTSLRFEKRMRRAKAKQPVAQNSDEEKTEEAQP